MLPLELLEEDELELEELLDEFDELEELDELELEVLELELDDDEEVLPPAPPQAAIVKVNVDTKIKCIIFIAVCIPEIGKYTA